MAPPGPRGQVAPDREHRELYAPFDRLANENPEVRGDIAALVTEAFGEGLPVYVTVNNKAEGSAPVSVEKLAAAVVARLAQRG